MGINPGVQRYRDSQSKSSKEGGKTPGGRSEALKPGASAAAAGTQKKSSTASAKGAEPEKNVVAKMKQMAGSSHSPYARNKPVSPTLQAQKAKARAAAASAAGARQVTSSTTAKVATTVVVDMEVAAALAAVEEGAQSSEATKALEAQARIEFEAEIVRDTAKASKLVKDDFSPLNSNRDKLILEYSPLIKYIAQKIAARLPANIELDDLISSGVIGLMDAIDKFDSTRDNKFKTYAEFRIRGAILDELRSQDWVPRSVREKSKLLERCYGKIEQEKGRQATDEEVCQELGISQEEFHDLLNQVRSVSLLSFDDISSFSKSDKRAIHGFMEGSPRAPTPFSEVNVAYLKKQIAAAINDLPEKQRLVLSLYYYEDLNLKEIGRVLDVTESRVSQLHTQAVLRLKARLRTNWDEFVALVG